MSRRGETHETVFRVPQSAIGYWARSRPRPAPVSLQGIRYQLMSARPEVCSIDGEEGQADPRRIAPELPCHLSRGGAAKAFEGVGMSAG